MIQYSYHYDNPGLSSRFSKTIYFPDYDPLEHAAVFRRFCDDAGYDLDDVVEYYLKHNMEKLIDT